MSNRFVCATAAFLVVALGAAHAARADDAEDDGFGRRGAYVGVGASRAVNFFESYFNNTPVLTDVHIGDTWGVNARAGYRVASFFAVEAEYEWLDDLSASLNGVHLASIQTQVATANFKLIGPFGRFQPYFLGGVGGVFFHSNGRAGFAVENSAFAGRVGLGIDLYITRSLLFNVGAEGMLTNAKVSLNTGSFSVSENGLGLVTIQFGLGYRF